MASSSEDPLCPLIDQQVNWDDSSGGVQLTSRCKWSRCVVFISSSHTLQSPVFGEGVTAVIETPPPPLPPIRPSGNTLLFYRLSLRSQTRCCALSLWAPTLCSSALYRCVLSRVGPPLWLLSHRGECDTVWSLSLLLLNQLGSSSSIDVAMLRQWSVY